MPPGAVAGPAVGAGGDTKSTSNLYKKALTRDSSVRCFFLFKLTVSTKDGRLGFWIRFPTFSDLGEPLNNF